MTFAEIETELARRLTERSVLREGVAIGSTKWKIIENGDWAMESLFFRLEVRKRSRDGFHLNNDHADGQTRWTQMSLMEGDETSPRWQAALAACDRLTEGEKAEDDWWLDDAKRNSELLDER